MTVNRLAEDDSDAGACARVRPKDYRQAKGGTKGGTKFTAEDSI